MGRPKGSKNRPRDLGAEIFRVRVGETVIPVFQSDIDRFDKYVLGGRWVGCAGSGGYGKIKVCGKDVLAHVFQWARYHKISIPKGFQIDHINFDRLDIRNDNLRCIPQWLNFKEVSESGNASRAQSRQKNGHLVRGEKHGLAKLSDDQVRAIRHEYETGGPSQQDLASEFGCAQATIWSIVNRRTRKIETHTEVPLE